MTITKSKPTINKPESTGSTTTLLAACGATYLPALWDVPFELPIGDYGYFAAKPALRELRDGNLRLAYQRDNSTLVVDTFNPAGVLLSRASFQQPFSTLHPLSTLHSDSTCYHNPLFLTDDILYLIGCNYAHSLRVELSSNSYLFLPMPDADPIASSMYFDVSDVALLDNGQLILVGGDMQPDQSFRARYARLLIVAPNGSVSSRVTALDSGDGVDEPYATVIPMGGHQFLVQHLQRYSDYSYTQFTEQGEGLILIPRPELHDKKLVYADAQGVWYSQLGNGIYHCGSMPEFNWHLPDLSIESIKPTSDGHYLALDFDAGQYTLLKITPTGRVQWSIDVTPGLGFKTVLVTERAGRILVTQGSHHVDPAVLVDNSKNPPETVATGNKHAKVQHRLLGLDGKDIARFAEPKYEAVLLRDPLRPEGYYGVHDYTPGCCLPLGAALLRNGNFASVSDWCSNQPFTDSAVRLFYFSLS